MKSFWNSRKYLSLATNLFSGFSILLTILVVYLTGSLSGLQNGVGYYNMNSLHYYANETAVQLILANPQLKYSSDLPKDAYLAYLKMQNWQYTPEQINEKLKGVIKVQDYASLRGDPNDSLRATNKYGQEYSDKSLILVSLIFRLTIFAAILQVIYIGLSLRRDHLEYSKKYT